MLIKVLPAAFSRLETRIPVCDLCITFVIFSKLFCFFVLRFRILSHTGFYRITHYVHDESDGDGKIFFKS